MTRLILETNNTLKIWKWNLRICFEPTINTYPIEKKLLEELTISLEQRGKIQEIDQRFIRNLKRVNQRVKKNGIEE